MSTNIGFAPAWHGRLYPRLLRGELPPEETRHIPCANAASAFYLYEIALNEGIDESDWDSPTEAPHAPYHILPGKDEDESYA